MDSRIKEKAATAIKRTFEKLGLQIRKRDPSRCASMNLQYLLSQFHIDCVLDVGANEGQFASEARELGYEGQIISFEPLPDAHSKLTKNAQHDKNWIIHERCALGETPGLTEINISKNSTSSSLLPIISTHTKTAPDSTYVSKAETEIQTLDQALANSDKSAFLLKIDTQGYESNVIQGASETLERTKVLQLELSLVELYKNQKLLKEMLTQIEDKGFEPWSFFPAFANRKTGQMLQLDGTFVSAQK